MILDFRTGHWNISRMKVLVEEKEKQIASFIRNGLEELGFTIELCHHGDDAYALVLQHPYDAIVLDIMLPGQDGLSILRKLRERKSAVPVILLTARGEMNERVEGLNLGADDYVTKPFFIEELAARLHAVIRRAAGEPATLLRVGDLTVDLISREVLRGKRPVELTAREFSLLTYLMRSPDHVFTRTQIVEHVWEYYFDPGTNLVDVYVQRLRRKLSEGGEPTLIETVRGIGYRMRKG